MKSIEKEIVKEEKQVEKFFKNKTNIWMTISAVLAVIVVIMLILSLSSWSPKGKAANKLVSYLNEKTGGGVTLLGVSSMGSIYEVNVSYQGQEIPVYVTKDGEYFLAGAEKITSSKTSANTNTNTNTPTSVPKTDKPKVELFVMSYCPYGTQAEKGIIPVYEMLGDKVDATIRFVHYTLHGDKEVQENYRQICIREEQKAKLLPYLKCILNSTNPNAPADVNSCMTSVGVDSAKVNDCIKNRAENYYKVDSQLSQQYGVQGSPTLVINGVESSAGRSPSAYLSGICGAFKSAPADCSKTVSSANPSAGFGYSTSDSAAAATCG
jgi:protein-disulfide isomerase